MIQNPRQFGGREIGIKQQTSFGRHHFFMASGFQGGTKICRAPILPHNSLVQGFARVPIPHHNRFTLIGNADCRNVSGFGACFFKCHFAGENHAAPNFLSIMFHPA